MKPQLYSLKSSPHIKLFLIPYFFLQEGFHNQMVMLNNNLLPRNHFDILYPVSLTAANKNVIDNCFCMTQCVHYKMANVSPKIDVYQFHTFPKCPLHQSYTPIILLISHMTFINFIKSTSFPQVHRIPSFPLMTSQIVGNSTRPLHRPRH